MAGRGLALCCLALAAAGAGPAAYAQRGQVAPYVDTIQPPFRLPPPSTDPSDKIYPPPARPEPIPETSRPVPSPYPGGRLAPQPAPLLPQGFTMTLHKSRAPERGASASLTRPREIAERLVGCWRPPPGRTASEATLRIAFTRAGGVLSEPRITYIKPGDGVSRAALRASVLEAVRRCTPLRFTPGLGSGISGRPFTLRFVAPAERGT